MRLLVDVGNTQVKYVFQSNEKDGALSEVVYLDYQSFQAQLNQGKFLPVSEVIFANVHGIEIDEAIKAWATLNNIALVQVNSAAKACGVTSSYQQPERLGVDRWLAMIGAKQLYPQSNLLIIDAGTATTVDLLAANGQHYGGWIMPGVQTMVESLLTRTHKIIASPTNTASLSFGMDSPNCLNHGSWAMTVGAVKEAILQANSLLTLDKVLITGGNGPSISKLMTDNFQLEPKLVFHGLSCFQAN
jgi:type III pantothenate kinase